MEIQAKQSFYKRENTNNIFWILFVTIFLTVITEAPIRAQNNQMESNVPTEKLRKNTKYYIAIYFDYKPGKAGEAFKLIEKYFIPVDKEAERFVIQFRPLTGTWDEIAFFPLEKGPDALAYALSPSDAKWNAILVKQLGSQKRVDEIWNKFNTLVLRKKKVLVTRPLVYK